MLPYLKNHPLTMHRYPDGIKGEDFFQKEVPDYFPKWIKTISVKNVTKGKTRYVLCQNKRTLVYLANQACLTPHLWLSPNKNLQRPDRLIFDLDPSGKSFQPVRQAARIIKKQLDDFKIPSFLMTTGSRGLHIWVPLSGKLSFERIHDFAKSFAKFMERKHSALITTATQKKRRGKKIFLDYLRNSYGQTSVAPYSLRARPGAPIAAPLHWKELSKTNLGPRSFHLKNIFRRLSQKKDPWKGFKQSRTSLKKAMDLLQS